MVRASSFEQLLILRDVVRLAPRIAVQRVCAVKSHASLLHVLNISLHGNRDFNTSLFLVLTPALIELWPFYRAESNDLIEFFHL